jgi:hypothetical protein
VSKNKSPYFRLSLRLDDAPVQYSQTYDDEMEIVASVVLLLAFSNNVHRKAEASRSRDHS